MIDRRSFVVGALQVLAASSFAMRMCLAASDESPLQVDWSILLPLSERGKPTPPPPASHDYLSDGDVVALQSGSFAVNDSLNGRRVRIPGFVVPLEFGPDRLLEKFLLVPYFGACIHLPPPPPNQVVYVQMHRGKGLRSIDDAQWVTGLLHTTIKSSDLGSASYVLDGELLEPYSR